MRVPLCTLLISLSMAALLGRLLKGPTSLTPSFHRVNCIRSSLRSFSTMGSCFSQPKAESAPTNGTSEAKAKAPTPTPAPAPRHQSHPMMSPSTSFLEALKVRRTHYALSAKSPIPDAKIQEIVKEVILHVPSSFNSQSERAIVLFKKDHEALWDITLEVLKAVVPADSFAPTAQKIAGFKAGYGTVLFFTHLPTVKGMQDAFPLYASNFPIWATQSDGMHQYAIWTALSLEGLGCNLQHYNELIEAKVKEKWAVEEGWQLSAQLVFGTPAGEAGKKEFKPVEGERLKVFGA